jgi:hypothetical protein
MKIGLALAAAVAIVALLLIHALMLKTSAEEAPVHLVNSFDVEVHLPYAQAAPLFGPEGERAWAGDDWNPEFIHPRPAVDEEGAVFTLRHAHGKAVWVNTAFDVPGEHFQYVYFIADKLVTTIDVRFTPVDDEATKVHVIYARTALKADANQHVRAMAEGDKKAGPEWQAPIDKYVASLHHSNPGLRPQV